MILTTTDSLQVVTDAAADIEVLGSYMDMTPGSPANVTGGGNTPTAHITTATTTTVQAAPGSGLRAVIKMSIKNNHASVACGVTVQFTNGTIVQGVTPKVNLLAGEVLYLGENGIWVHSDVNGGQYPAATTGRFLRTTVLTAGTSHTTHAAATQAFVRLCGAGGGGAGCTSVASAAAAGGGGGGGGYAEKTFAVSPNTAYAYAIGAAGTGVSGAAGNNGGDTTFTVGATTVTAKGGSGAPVATATTALTARAGGAGGTISTNGDLNSGGMPGNPGVILIVTGSIGASGAGGSSEFGAGGLGIVAAGNGNAGIGYGAGGGGSLTAASAVRTGGNGTGGCIIVDEYA